jgi:Fur family transcriptional regulator, ferric uptake regulator
MQNEILEKFKKQGFRLTPVRKFIVGFFVDNDKPIDAITLQSKVAKSVKKVNKTTIYREIDFLLAQSIIKEINFGDGRKRYELSTLPHHHHVVCMRCESVEDILADKLREFEQKISKLANFKIINHNLEFFGLCGKCV